MVNMKLAALVAVSAAQMGDNFAPALEQPRKLAPGEEGTAEAATAAKEAVLALIEAEITKQGATLTDALDAEAIKTKAGDYYTALEKKFDGGAEEMKKALTADNVTKLFAQTKKGVLDTADEIAEKISSLDFFKSFQQKLQEKLEKLTAWGESLKTNLTTRFEEAQKKLGAGKDEALVKVHAEIGKLIDAGNVTTESGKADLVAGLEKLKADTTDKPAQDFVAQEIAELSAGPEGEEKPNNAAMLSFSALLFCVVMSF